MPRVLQKFPEFVYSIDHARPSTNERRLIAVSWVPLLARLDCLSMDTGIRTASSIIQSPEKLPQSIRQFSITNGDFLGSGLLGMMLRRSKLATNRGLMRVPKSVSPPRAQSFRDEISVLCQWCDTHARGCILREKSRPAKDRVMSAYRNTQVLARKTGPRFHIAILNSRTLLTHQRN
jgi:hypothetical protein